MGAQPSSLKRSFDLPVVSEPHKRRKTNTGSALARNTDLSLASRSSVDSGSNSVFQGEHVIQFAHGLSDEQKSITLQFMLKNSLFDRSLVSAPALTTVACEHNVKFRSADAREAGQCVINGDGLVPLDRSRTFFRNDAAACKIFHDKASHRQLKILEEDEIFGANSWPQLESEESLKQIIMEHLSQTTAA
ncbi:hypothetical protein B0H13DRAFT_1879422 [Mycena leptocephala]|nr:hypothetical protein B0H13DRAFT_1879422 [Mycena leptocephala]